VTLVCCFERAQSLRRPDPMQHDRRSSSYRTKTIFFARKRQPPSCTDARALRWCICFCALRALCCGTPQSVPRFGVFRRPSSPRDAFTSYVNADAQKLGSCVERAEVCALKRSGRGKTSLERREVGLFCSNRRKITDFATTPHTHLAGPSLALLGGLRTRGGLQLPRSPLAKEGRARAGGSKNLVFRAKVWSEQ